MYSLKQFLILAGKYVPSKLLILWCTKKGLKKYDSACLACDKNQIVIIRLISKLQARLWIEPLQVAGLLRPATLESHHSHSSTVRNRRWENQFPYYLLVSFDGKLVLARSEFKHQSAFQATLEKGTLSTTALTKSGCCSWKCSLKWLRRVLEGDMRRGLGFLRSS